MKHIVLAAGYATRLYPVTEHFPKPLLEIGGISILDRLISDVDTIEDVDTHLIVSNHKYLPHFEKWKSNSRYTKNISIIDDGSDNNENRLGAVNDLLLAIEVGDITDDLLVLAADNVVDFSFQGLIDFFKQKQTSLITTYYEPELSALQRTGVVTIDNDNKALEMQEKPEKPKSHHAVPPFYIYKKNDIPLIKSCVQQNSTMNVSLQNAAPHASYYMQRPRMDAPGNLVRYMLDKTIFHAWPMPGNRYDIGSLETYYNLKDKPLILNH